MHKALSRISRDLEDALAIQQAAKRPIEPKELDCAFTEERRQAALEALRRVVTRIESREPSRAFTARIAAFAGHWGIEALHAWRAQPLWWRCACWANAFSIPIVVLIV
jgi:hypothetical protein